MPTATVNGVRLFFAHSGYGPPLLLIHGSWADHAAWDQVVPALAQHFRVLTYDRRGHSQSQRPSTQGSTEDDVDDLRPFGASVSYNAIISGLADPHFPRRYRTAGLGTPLSDQAATARAASSAVKRSTIESTCSAYQHLGRIGHGRRAAAPSPDGSTSC